MSRHGYCDEWGTDNNQIFLYRQAVERALKGKRGQKFLRELVAALEAMPEKKLAHGQRPVFTRASDEYALVHEGGCCGLGAVALARGIDTSDVDVTDRDILGELFDIAPVMAAEIEYVNDERAPDDPERRWQYVYGWAKGLLAA